MPHDDEYTDNMIAAMDLIWGEGFMAPGGTGHVKQMVKGLDLDGCRVLDIGCGQGRPACMVAAQFKAHVVGIDLEKHLIERAKVRAEDESLGSRTTFIKVDAGPLLFENDSFDLVMISGAMTQIEDKLSMYRECLRVLKPGGVFSSYDWMKPEGPLSDDMHYWFELEGLTYALATPEAHINMMQQAGYQHARYRDKSAWYRDESRREYELIKGAMKPELVSLLGDEDTLHFIEDWRLLNKLCENGELLQVYIRARKPDAKP